MQNIEQASVEKPAVALFPAGGKGRLWTLSPRCHR